MRRPGHETLTHVVEDAMTPSSAAAEAGYQICGSAEGIASKCIRDESAHAAIADTEGMQVASDAIFIGEIGRTGSDTRFIWGNTESFQDMSDPTRRKRSSSSFNQICVQKHPERKRIRTSQN